MIEFADAAEQLKPDLILVLGDRYEVFCACAIAIINYITTTHLHGGEKTEGVIDEALPYF